MSDASRNRRNLDILRGELSPGDWRLRRNLDDALHGDDLPPAAEPLRSLPSVSVSHPRLVRYDGTDATNRENLAQFLVNLGNRLLSGEVSGVEVGMGQVDAYFNDERDLLSLAPVTSAPPPREGIVTVTFVLKPGFDPVSLKLPSERDMRSRDI